MYPIEALVLVGIECFLEKKTFPTSWNKHFYISFLKEDLKKEIRQEFFLKEAFFKKCLKKKHAERIFWKLVRKNSFKNGDSFKGGDFWKKLPERSFLKEHFNRSFLSKMH